MADLNLFFLRQGDEKRKVIPMEQTPQPKPGWKTTELWLSLAAALFGVLLSAGVFTPQGGCTEQWCTIAQTVIGGIVTVLAAMGYQWTRAKLKASVAASSSSPANGTSGN